MASPSPTREHLLEVGLRQLRSTGYTATGVKEILGLAKVPKGSFYHYFPSKEAFVAELLDRYAQQEIERLQRILGDTSVAPIKRLRLYFEDMLAVYGRQGEGTGCLMGSMSLEVGDHIPNLQQKLHAIYISWQDALTGVLREAINAGELPASTQPEALAEFILNSYQGALVRMKGDQSERPQQNFLHFVFEILLTK
jgi:TetR/AcrR family transcriptional repressor of nem operon